MLGLSKRFMCILPVCPTQSLLMKENFFIMVFVCPSVQLYIILQIMKLSAGNIVSILAF